MVVTVHRRCHVDSPVDRREPSVRRIEQNAVKFVHDHRDYGRAHACRRDDVPETAGTDGFDRATHPGGGLRRHVVHRGRSHCVSGRHSGRARGTWSRDVDRRRGRVPSQPDDHRPGGVGTPGVDRRSFPTRPRHPGPYPRRETLRRRLRTARPTPARLRLGRQGLLCSVPRASRSTITASSTTSTSSIASGVPARSNRPTRRSTSRRSTRGCCAWRARSPTESTSTRSASPATWAATSFRRSLTGQGGPDATRARSR